jgi:hypothetical protein
MTTAPRNLHVECLNRNRVACSLRTVARLIRLASEELSEAQKLAGQEIGDERLLSTLLHAQNRLTQSSMDLPDLGAMELEIEQLRLQAFGHRVPREEGVYTEHITSDFGAKIRAEGTGAKNVRQPEGVAV